MPKGMMGTLSTHIIPIGIVAYPFTLLRDNLSRKTCICERNPFFIDRRMRVKIIIPILRNCLVNHDRFKRHFLYLELKTVEKYDVLDRVFSKRLETEAFCSWST